jgi:hypothetical protein
MESQPSLIALRKRLPPFHEISSFYATIVFLVYGWTSVAFFWKVPSWSYFLSPSEIVVILAYVLVSSLFESVLILFVFLLASLVLPSDWLSHRFVVRSSLIIFALTFWVALFDLSSLVQLPTRSDVISFGIGFPLTAGLSILLANRTPLVRRLMIFVSDQLIVFLYLWLPLSLIGILIVILRIV